MKLVDVMEEVRKAIKENRPALLWVDWDSSYKLTGDKATSQPEQWGLKAPIGGCGCVRKPRGRVVMCGVKRWVREWPEGYYRVYAEYDAHELLKLMTEPCRHGTIIWER